MAKLTKLLALSASSLMALSLIGCGAKQESSPSSSSSAEVSNSTSSEVSSSSSNEVSSSSSNEVSSSSSSEVKVNENIKRNPAIHTMTSLIDGRGYSKLESFDTSDLYISVSQVMDYEVFYGYSMEAYYNIYPQYFQEFAADGTTVTKDYLKLLKAEIGTETYAQVTDKIAEYLEKIASLYYGASNSSYWTYFCFIPEDAQEYQQLYDSKAVAKVTGYEQSDLYISANSVLSYAYYGYTMKQYHTWYSSYGYFSVDGVDYCEELVKVLDGKLYIQVTDEVKAIIQKISTAFWGSDAYWTYFCSIKTEIIPEAKYETVTTDYYKLLEEECGHNKFVKVTPSIKEALKYLSSTFYGDPQYWDYWTYTTPSVTGEDAAAMIEATSASDLEGKDAYISLAAKDADLYNYSIAEYYGWYPTYFQSGENDYYTQLQALVSAEGYTKVTPEILELVKKISGTFYSDEQYYYAFLSYSGTPEYVTLVDTTGEYKTVEYSDSDLYVNLDVTFDYTWVWGDSKYTMAQWYSYGGTYAANFIKTELVEVKD